MLMGLVDFIAIVRATSDNKNKWKVKGKPQIYIYDR
jgi:hypothetical protein